MSAAAQSRVSSNNPSNGTSSDDAVRSSPLHLSFLWSRRRPGRLSSANLRLAPSDAGATSSSSSSSVLSVPVQQPPVEQGRQPPARRILAILMGRRGASTVTTMRRENDINSSGNNGGVSFRSIDALRCTSAQETSNRCTQHQQNCNSHSSFPASAQRSSLITTTRDFLLPRRRLSDVPEEIPEREEYNAVAREAGIGLVEAGWRNALKSMNNYTFELFPPQRENIIKQGWLWKLSEYSNVFRRRFAVLLADGDLVFYTSPQDLGRRRPTESLKAGDYVFAADCGLRQPRRLEIESGVRTRSMIVCLVAPSVAEKLAWIEILIAVLMETSHRAFEFDPDLQLSIRAAGRSHLLQVVHYIAPHLVQELVHTIAPKAVRKLPRVARAV